MQVQQTTTDTLQMSSVDIKVNLGFMLLPMVYFMFALMAWKVCTYHGIYFWLLADQ
jgi:hypothetical protein